MPITTAKGQGSPWGFLGEIKGVLIIFSLALYFYSLASPLEEFSPPGQLGPAFWPKLSLLFLMIGCGIKAGETYYSRRKKSAPEEQTSVYPPANFLKLGVMIGLIILVVIGMETIGFLLANFLFLILFMRVAGVKRKFPLFLTSFLGTIILLFIFVKIVYLPLPRGQGIFNDLTIYLYRILHFI